MDAPPPRQQLLLALPELFPGDDNIEFCGEAAVAIGQKPADWAPGLLGLPIGYRRAAIKAAVRGARVRLWYDCPLSQPCSAPHVHKSP
jgi:hypothetical protein